MTQANSALSSANGVLRAHRLPFRLRAGHNSRWVSVYENLPGRRVRERAVRGCSSQDDLAIEELCFRLVSEARRQPGATLEQLLGSPGDEPDGMAPRLAPSWPEICDAVVAFQRRQGVNMNLVGPFKGQGYFRLLPADRAAREADVRRFALHTGDSLRAHLADPAEPLVPVATHRQGFRQKREVVSLLRRAGFGSIAPESLSEELKGMVNHKKVVLLAAGESRRRIPSTEAIQEWLDQVIEEDPLWGWLFAMVATYGLRPHEVWHIDGLPDENGLITIGVAARHIKVTKTGFRAAVPLPAEWVDRYRLGGSNGEQRLEELRRRHVPKFVNEDGEPFDPERDLLWGSPSFEDKSLGVTP